MKLQRLIAILTALLGREYISAAVLSEKFGVSVRTIYRDMQALEQAGIPIVTNPGPNGGFGIVEQYKIDKKLFTDEDIATLLVSLASVSGPVPDAVINRTLEKIKGLIPRERRSSIELTSRQLYIDMTPWSNNLLVTETISLAREAMERSRLVRFDYFTRHGETSRRTAEPHQLALKENNWYLRAWCKTREDFRTFKISRMRNLELLGDVFTPREFESEFDDFKDWRHERMIYVDIVIDESLRTRAMDFCREEYMKDLADGKIAIHMPFVESEMGYGVLLSLGDAGEVLGPPHIRNELIRRIGRLKDVYDTRE